MKVMLEVGKFYRRENGVLVRYVPGDVFSASPDEFERLQAKEQVFVRQVDKPKEQTPEKQVEPPVDESPVEQELSDDDLLARHTTRSGSWFIFEDGSKVQGRAKALEILRELHG